jgi:hypothetical protein
MMNRTALRWVLGLVLLAAVGVALTQHGRFDAATLQAWVEGARAAGPLLFMGLYAVATVLFLPGAVITLAGGALFGPLWGTLWNLTGATVGARWPSSWPATSARTGWRAVPVRGCNGSMTVWRLNAGASSPSCGWYRCSRSTC